MDYFDPFANPFAHYNPIVKVALVWREKLHGPGKHFGVAFAGSFDEVVETADVAIDRAPRFCSLEEFADGREHHVVEWITDPVEVEDCLLRLEKLRSGEIEWQFNPTTANCEHFARWVAKGESESGQIRALVGAALLFIGFVFLK